MCTKDIYTNACDELPHNMPEGWGEEVDITIFVDETEIIIYVNMTPIIWYS